MPDKNQNPPQSELEKQLAAEAKLAGYRKEIAQATQEEAKLEKQFIDNQKAKQEADRDAFKAPEVKALEGKITATGNFVETKILANECLSEVIAKLASAIYETDQVFTSDKLVFVFYNAQDFPNIEQYIALQDQLKVLQKLLSEAILIGQKALEKEDNQDAAGGSAASMVIGLAASGVIRTAADIFSLFKTNAAITNFEINSDDSVLVSCFWDKYKAKNPACKFYYPAVYPVNLINSPDANSSEFIKLFNAVKNLEITAVGLLNQIQAELTAIEQQLPTLTDPVAISPLKVRNQKLNAAVPELQSVTTAFSQLEMTLVTIDPNTKLSTRAIVLRAEKLVSVLNGPNTYIIKLSAKLNGSTRIKDGLFKITSSVMHSGGAQVNCLIFSKDGSILFSDNGYCYEPYQEVKKRENHFEVRKTSQKLIKPQSVVNEVTLEAYPANEDEIKFHDNKEVK